MLVFIVEDDKVIAGAMAAHLQSWGLKTYVVTDFKNVLTEFVSTTPELVLMDISLPFFNGYHWCTEIRRISKAPIIFISSASDNLNIVMAMNMGADDFISKPFDLTVLTAKVNAMLRRSYEFAPQSGLVCVGKAVLNTREAQLSVDGERVELSRNEYRILQVLIERRGSIVSRDELMNSLWETDSYVDENTLNVNVLRLRKRLEAVGLGELIKTKRGMGYTIDPDSEH
ncbi:MAG TPA: response regulator transcription factor [Eubacteriales bacterium]|nr:response regulator transcription factor [Clostridia bacterium]HRV72911.1 response regulator transcription factor [Eubacteriales bacterium]